MSRTRELEMKQALCRGCQIEFEPNNRLIAHTEVIWSTELAGRTSQLANEMSFFQRGLAEKPSPSYILFRIWLIWLDKFWLKVKFSLRQEWSGRSVLANGKHPLVNTFYMCCLGRLLNLKWAAKVNKSDVLEGKTNFPSVFNLLKQRWMRWLSHVAKMNDDRTPEELL